MAQQHMILVEAGGSASMSQMTDVLIGHLKK